MDTFLTYQRLTKNMASTLQKKLGEPDVKRETEYYLNTVGSIKTVDDFLGNYRVFKYAMTAFGLEDMANAKGYMRKILTDGPSGKFVSRLTDDRFQAFAATFDFSKYGEKTMQQSAARTGVVDGYTRETLEADAGAEDQGVALALYFIRTAPNVKSTYGILSDPKMSRVVRTIFGLSDQMAAGSIESQAATISRLLDVKDFQDSAKLDRLAKRFTIVWDATNNAGSAPILQLFQRGAGGSLESTMALLKLPYGG